MSLLAILLLCDQLQSKILFDEALRVEQTNQITKAHRIINSSTSLCFLELVCVQESGETLQININILKISKAE